MRNGKYITSLRIPTPGVAGDSGSDAANGIINSLDAIDSHSHSGSGSGVKLGTASISVDSNLSLNGYALIDSQKVIFVNQTVVPTDSYGLYVKDGYLWYRNATLNIQITDASGVKVSGIGSLTGVSGSAAVNYSTINGKVWQCIDEDGSFSGIQGSKLQLFGTNGKYFRIYSATPTNNFDLVFPAYTPVANNQFLVSSTTGVLSWKDSVIKGATNSSVNNLAIWSATSNELNGITINQGQVLIGTTTAPVSAYLTGTTSQIVVTSTTGSIVFSLPQNIDTAASVVFNTVTATAAMACSTFSCTSSGVISNLTVNALTGGGVKLVAASNSGVLQSSVATSATGISSTVALRNASGELVSQAFRIDGNSAFMTAGQVSAPQIVGTNITAGASGFTTTAFVDSPSYKISGVSKWDATSFTNPTITASTALNTPTVNGTTVNASVGNITFIQNCNSISANSATLTGVLSAAGVTVGGGGTTTTGNSAAVSFVTIGGSSSLTNTSINAPSSTISGLITAGTMRTSTVSYDGGSTNFQSRFHVATLAPLGSTTINVLSLDFGVQGCYLSSIDGVYYPINKPLYPISISVTVGGVMTISNISSSDTVYVRLMITYV